MRRGIASFAGTAKQFAAVIKLAKMHGISIDEAQRILRETAGAKL